MKRERRKQANEREKQNEGELAKSREKKKEIKEGIISGEKTK